MHQKVLKPAAATTANGLRVTDQAGELIGPTHKPPRQNPQALRAELFGSDRCTAEGITATSSSPVIALCRKLIEAGVDPVRPLIAYRDETLCLRVRSIGAAAGTEINGHGTGFVRRLGGGTAPPVSLMVRRRQ
jgi:hypothetical protein